VRVMLAEDNLLVRAGLVALFQTIAEITLVSILGSLQELLDAVDAELPDVVLTDIRMPPTHTDEGIRAAVVLRDRHPSVGVVVLSQYLDPVQALALVEGGSRRRGYLLKDRLADPMQLVHAIGAVARGGSYMDPLVVDALVDARYGSSRQLQRLTPRETEVLEAVAMGMSNRAIAESLAVTDRAVEKHINSIFSKLGLDGSSDVHRRVASVLLYLAPALGGGGGTTSDAGRST
jgi:DNA-binding NarL/FixJ family response regulator